MASDPVETPKVTAAPEKANQESSEQHIRTYNEKRAYLASLVARMDSLTAQLKQLTSESKRKGPSSAKNESKEEKKEEADSKPEEAPEKKDEEAPQVLPSLFGLAYILLKLLCQEKLNKQSVFNFNNYYEFIKNRITTYESTWKVASIVGYTLKKDEVLESIKSFYSYLFMASSPKLQELFKTAEIPAADGLWLSILTEEDNKVLMESVFMTVLDDLFKNIRTAFTTMDADANSAALRRGDMLKAKGKDLKDLDTQIGTLNAGPKTTPTGPETTPTGPQTTPDQKGGAAPVAPATPIASAPTIADTPIKPPSLPIPECNIGEPCKRDILKLKEYADYVNSELMAAIANGPIQMKDDLTAVNEALSILATEAPTIHISMVKHAGPPTDKTPTQELQDLQPKMIAKLNELKKKIQTGPQDATTTPLLAELDKSISLLTTGLPTLLQTMTPTDAEALLVNMKKLTGMSGGKRGLRRS